MKYKGPFTELRIDWTDEHGQEHFVTVERGQDLPTHEDVNLDMGIDEENKAEVPQSVISGLAEQVDNWQGPEVDKARARQERVLAAQAEPDPVEPEPEELTGKALKDRAAELDIDGRSKMDAAELRDAVAKAEEQEQEAAQAAGLPTPEPGPGSPAGPNAGDGEGGQG